jgi:hypothetical protein
MVLITIVTEAYKPTYNWGASHCTVHGCLWQVFLNTNKHRKPRADRRLAKISHLQEDFVDLRLGPWDRTENLRKLGEHSQYYSSTGILL